MNKRKKFLAPVLCAALLLLPSCAAGSGRDIRLAVTGDREVYDYDPSILNAVDLAVDECGSLYAGDGWRISAETVDDGSVYDVGVTQAAALAEDPGVTAILGTHNFAIADMAAELASQNGVLYAAFNGCDDAVTAGDYRTVLSNVYNAAQCGAAMGRYVAQASGLTRLAVYSSSVGYETDWIRAFCRALEGGAAQVVDCVGTAADGAEFRADARRWRQLGVDGVLVLEYYADDAYAAAQWLHDQLPQAKLLGDSSFDYQARLSQSADAVEGLVIVDVLPSDGENGMADFRARYRERYGATPSRWAAHAYDTVRMLVDTAVAQDTTDAAVIADALRAEPGYAGVCGTLRFDAGGALTGGEPGLLVCRNGAFTALTGEEGQTQ